MLLKQDLYIFQVDFCLIPQILNDQIVNQYNFIYAIHSIYSRYKSHHRLISWAMGNVIRKQTHPFEYRQKFSQPAGDHWT